MTKGNKAKRQQMAGAVLVVIGAVFAGFAIPAWLAAPDSIPFGEPIDPALFFAVFKANALAFLAAAGLVIGGLVMFTARYAPGGAQAEAAKVPAAKGRGIGLAGPWLMIVFGLAVLVVGPALILAQLKNLAASMSQAGGDLSGFNKLSGIIFAIYAVYGLPLLIGGIVLLRRARTEQAD